VSQPTTREELFDALRGLSESSELARGMRTGQLVAAVGEVCSDLHGRGLWDASDDELLEAVWRFRCNLEAAIPTPVENEA
jgi:hypothetical protein